MNKLLVIGYGNPMRRDDGLGWFIANRLSQSYEEDARISSITSFQLMPEMADAISNAAHVIFVDASIGKIPGEWRVQSIFPHDAASNTTSFTHHLGPQQLLKMAGVLYGNVPEARLITITGQDFEFGEGFSPAIAASVEQVIAHIEGVLRQ